MQMKEEKQSKKINTHTHSATQWRNVYFKESKSFLSGVSTVFFSHTPKTLLNQQKLHH